MLQRKKTANIQYCRSHIKKEDTMLLYREQEKQANMQYRCAQQKEHKPPANIRYCYTPKLLFILNYYTPKLLYPLDDYIPK